MSGYQWRPPSRAPYMNFIGRKDDNKDEPVHHERTYWVSDLHEPTKLIRVNNFVVAAGHSTQNPVEKATVKEVELLEKKHTGEMVRFSRELRITITRLEKKVTNLESVIRRKNDLLKALGYNGLEGDDVAGNDKKGDGDEGDAKEGDDKEGKDEGGDGDGAQLQFDVDENTDRYETFGFYNDGTKIALYAKKDKHAFIPTKGKDEGGDGDEGGAKEGDVIEGDAKEDDDKEGDVEEGEEK